MSRKCPGDDLVASPSRDIRGIPTWCLCKARRLRNDNKISRQWNLHFQNCIVMAFPTKNSVLDYFLSLSPRPPPPQKAKSLFLLSSRRLWKATQIWTECPQDGQDISTGQTGHVHEMVAIWILEVSCLDCLCLSVLFLFRAARQLLRSPEPLPELRWRCESPGDSREAIRRKQKPILITCERFMRIASNLRFAIFSPPKRDLQGKGVQFRNPETIHENQAIRENRRRPDYSSNLCPPKIWSIWLFRGCFGPASCSFSCRKGPKTPPKKVI